MSILKERLLLISDLWGRERSQWAKDYIRILETKFEIEFYDSCELGQIDRSDYTQESIHNQFVNGGIKKAVENLLDREKHKVNILAFSIGGTIAWKFGLKSDNLNTLVCVSSTRLRNETEKPGSEIKLYFGENDEYKPSEEWFENMKVDYEILTDKGHTVYCEPDFTKQLCEKIIA